MTATTVTTTTPPGPGPSLRQALAPLRHSLVLAERTLRKIRRTPEQLIDVTVQPIIFLGLFVYLFGGAIAGSTHEYLQYVLPALLVQNGLFVATAIGVNLNSDITKGVFDRFRSLPIARSSPLVGAVLGDVVRFVLSITVLMAVGLLMGFDATGGPVRTLAACVLLVGFSLCVSWIFVLVGLVARSAGAVQGIAFLLVFPLTFGSSTFVAVDTMPGWLQSWVRVNPVTHLVDAVRGLMLGTPYGSALWLTIAWGAGLVLVFAPLAVRAYRAKAH